MEEKLIKLLELIRDAENPKDAADIAISTILCSRLKLNVERRLI